MNISQDYQYSVYVVSNIVFVFLVHTIHSTVNGANHDIFHVSLSLKSALIRAL